MASKASPPSFDVPDGNAKTKRKPPRKGTGSGRQGASCQIPTGVQSGLSGSTVSPSSGVPTANTKPKRKPASRGTGSEPRTRPFPIRLSEEEHLQIAEQAERFHLEMATYIRARIFDYPLPSRRGAIDDEKYAELSRLVMDLRNAGSNINQLAHSCNLGFPVTVQAALDGITLVREALDRVRLHLVQIADDFEKPKAPASGDVVEEIWSEE